MSLRRNLPRNLKSTLKYHLGTGPCLLAGIFHIAVPDLENAHIEIYAPAGIPVLVADNSCVDLSGFASGIYLLRSMEGEKIRINKLVKE